MNKEKVLKYFHVQGYTSILICLSLTANAQKISQASNDSTMVLDKKVNYKNQRDLIDIERIIVHKNPDKRLDSNEVKNTKMHIFRIAYF